MALRLSEAAKKIVKDTYKPFSEGGAYSALAYTRSGWGQATEILLRRGYTVDQVERILRSKATRWARDSWEGHCSFGWYTSTVILSFLDKSTKEQNIADWCN